MHSAEDGYRARERDSFARRFTARLRDACSALAEAIEGIESVEMRSRYASLLLNRLLYLFFLQRMGLLAGDPQYLQRRLAQILRESEGNFYRDILRPLFTGSTQAEPCLLFLSGLFTSRTLEQKYPALSIANEVFVDVFALFEKYCWRPDDAIASELLGALFAQHTQSREMGGYSTPDAITVYIARNTIFPALFARMFEQCGAVCASDCLLWQQLARQPEHYLFAAERKGCLLPLPEEIAVGLEDVARRQSWQKVASEQYALPGEIWREVVARRAHVAEIVARCRENAAGELARLVTWNINQQLLALETLCACQQPEVLANFYQSLRRLTILDPTCGSGAFLCAAMSQLEPLYTVCLARMEELLNSSETARLARNYRRAFHNYLEEAGEASWRRATILRLIVERNLYGVDLMEEVAEACQLCLSLRILAVLPGQVHAGFLRDFGRNIRVGNCLVGSLSDDPGRAVKRRSSIDTDDESAFHWSQAFPETMARGGFDVVLGNPPYVECERIRSLYTVDGYATMQTGNLYALTMERGTHLLAPAGRFGMIVPASATCTDGYSSLQKLLLAQQELHIASFSDQRGHLFALPHPRLCIILYAKAPATTTRSGRIFTTPYIKLGPEPHSSVFEHLRYTEVTRQIEPGRIPRYGSPLEQAIHDRLARQSRTLGHYFQPAGAYAIYYTRKLSWFVQVTPFIPRILDEQGQLRMPSELKTLRFASPEYAQIAFVALNSNLFYWLITTGSDCRNLNLREVRDLPLDLASVHPALQQELCQLAHTLEEDLRAHSRMKQMVFRGKGSLTIQCMYPARSKRLIDEVDCLLARHYGFSAEELDFLLHYDGQYRVDRSLKEKHSYIIS